MIAQDWPLAEALAKEIPFPKSTSAAATMSLSLLRFAVLDRKRQVEKRCVHYSAHLQGIDFPPRRPGFALAIVYRDGTLLAKELRSTIQAFRRKWDMKKYLTPRRLREYIARNWQCKTREDVVKSIAQTLYGYNWQYSYWAVAMMCLAGRVGIEIPTDPRKYSDFVPCELCMPAS